MKNYCKKHKIERKCRIIRCYECGHPTGKEYFCPICEKERDERYEKKLEKDKTKCKNCHKKEANFREWSPDGAPDYFCSIKCHQEYKKKFEEKGIFWRALPLEKYK